jgi:transglutaminase-like putative cysteine protease
MPARSSVAAALLAGLTLGSAAAALASQPAERSFEFTYKTIVSNLPEGARKVALWLPYPTSDRNQVISEVHVRSPFPTSLRKDPLYGNTILYVDVERPRDRAVEVEMDFKVRRLEYVRRDFASAAGPGVSSASAAGAAEQDPLLSRWLKPDALVPLDDFVRKLAAEVTAGKTTPLEKARAIYDHAVRSLKYDKTGTGWGRGDIYYACNVKKGNCTDFHALFIGLCRASGIPAKFAIGFPLPEDRREGEIGGYHCWAEFHLDGYGWVPVDASEASKNPAKADYFFGAHDANRVQFTIGRDIRLDPPQSGDPVNFFIYPYVEVDGKPFTDVQKRFFFKDSGAAAGESGQ